MIEVIESFDLVPGVDQDAYQSWAKKAVALVLQQPGLVELRANRNILGSPQVRIVTVWKSGADWAKFGEGAWRPLESELLKFATNLKAELWGPSALVPEPLRPGK